MEGILTPDGELGKVFCRLEMLPQDAGSSLRCTVSSSRCRVFLKMHGVSLEMGSVLPEMDSALSEMESVFLICLPLFPNQEMLNSN